MFATSHSGAVHRAKRRSTASRLAAILAATVLAGPGATGCAASPTGHHVGAPEAATPRASASTAVLATGVTLGRAWQFTYTRNSRGEDCIAVAYGSTAGIPACGFEVDGRYPIDAAMQQVAPQVTAIYGEVAPGLTSVSVAKNTSNSRLPTYAAPNLRSRYFVVLAIRKDVRDIWVENHTRRASLVDKLTDFYTPG